MIEFTVLKQYKLEIWLSNRLHNDNLLCWDKICFMTFAFGTLNILIRWCTNTFLNWSTLRWERAYKPVCIVFDDWWTGILKPICNQLWKNSFFWFQYLVNIYITSCPLMKHSFSSFFSLAIYFVRTSWRWMWLILTLPLLQLGAGRFAPQSYTRFSFLSIKI